MGKNTYNSDMADRQTKPCPFCGEQILLHAVKCRYCKEFLEPDEDTLPQSYHAVRRSQPRQERQYPPPPFGRRQSEPDESEARQEFEYSIRPSLLALAGTGLGALILLAIAVAIMAIPFEVYLAKFFSEHAGQVNAIAQWIHLAGFVMGIVIVIRFVLKALYLKSIHYDISPDRIEWARGIFSRKIDNLDMFRVVDIKLHRSMLDCMLGIGSVTLVTKDETDPLFDFEKVRRPRHLYDMIKKASLAADRKQGVVHIE